MGGGKQQTIEQFFSFDVVSKNLYEQTTKNTSRAVASQTGINRLKIVISGNNIGCDINVNQSVDAQMQTDTSVVAELIVENKAQINNDLQAAMEANMDLVTEMGNLEFGNEQNLKQQMRTRLENIIERTITTENVSEAFGEQVAINRGELIIRGNMDCTSGYGGINFSQDITMQMGIKATLDMLKTAITNDEMTNKIKAAADASVTQENKGIADVVKSFGASWIALFGLCIMVFATLAVLGMSGGGGNKRGGGGPGNGRLPTGKKF
jgi:hypothetical protein